MVDADRNSISLFKDKTSLPITVGGYGWTSTSFDGPAGIATDGINVYIADHGNHRIQRFDRNLNFMSTFSTRDTSVVEARFGYPSGAAISRFGDLFILDEENIRVVKFNARSQFERAFGSLGDERGKLQHPIKILLSSDDHVYVLEPSKIIVYDYFGNYVQTIGVGTLHHAKGFAVGRENNIVVTSDTLYWFSKQGSVEYAATNN
ncbi:MAG: NHL repeat-containing protein [Ignavibacteriales bacterium]|nr:NHL repeat-containing protein [Ignavibacteriales bacterium]